MTQIFRGKSFSFVVGARLASGGMGEVYLGNVEGDPGAAVALKVPLPSLGDAEKALFLREAEAASQVVSPHVVKVVDWGESPPFIAFEFVSGPTLDKVLAQRVAAQEPFALPELITYLRQLVDAMRSINEHVVHRDLKPENIFHCEGSPKITDFGIAKYVGEVTRSRSFKGWGTPAYQAPETWRLDTVDWRADQYSLGAVFFELAALRRPFLGRPEEMEHAHLFQRPPLLTSLVPRLPPRLATVVTRMLEKQPGDRFPDWNSLAADLDKIGASARQDAEPAPDPLVGKIASKLEAVRVGELEQLESDEKAARERADRAGLLQYWVGEMLAEVKRQTEGINEALGRKAIELQPLPGGRSGCRVKVLEATLELEFAACRADGPSDCLAWGRFDMRTSRRASVGNLLLVAEPPPYGTWMEVNMEISALVQGIPDLNAEDKGEGRYEILKGHRRFVAALNMEGLLFQRGWRNVTSLVKYREQPLSFRDLVRQMLEAMVEDGGGAQAVSMR